ncbi:amidohydrolase, partial [Salmonella enterica subsp. enterica]|nr:amidohydrolase [Salmonella enterica subsp. enterica serovar Enteritidis]
MIDAHQHFWKVDRGDYGWLDGAPELLRRNWLPADLAPLLKRFGVTRTVLVQAAPTAAETDYLLGLAGAHDFIAGVVGWLDLEADSFGADVARLKQRPKFLGLRPMLQDLDDDRWILRPKVLAALKVMQDQDIAFDILCLPRHLPHVIAAMSEVPRLRAVLDHLGKPPVASGDLAAWRAHIAGLAGLPNVYCKLSGLVTEADHANWTVADLAPYAAEA